LIFLPAVCDVCHQKFKHAEARNSYLTIQSNPQKQTKFKYEQLVIDRRF
jgi:hypothetical protein